MQSGSHCCQRLPLPEARHSVNIGCEFTVVTRPFFFESSSEHQKKITNVPGWTVKSGKAAPFRLISETRVTAVSFRFPAARSLTPL
jgi:hypothetical protein